MSETVEIPIEEYENLLVEQRRVQAIRIALDEFYMRRKLLRARITDGPNYNLHNLRKVTLAKISVFASKGWHG